jgi:hypothetical protein
MGEKVFLSYSMLMDFTMIISLTTSIICWKNFKNYKYLRFFPFYTAFSIMVDLESYLPEYYNLKALPENIFTIVEFFFFYNFFNKIFYEKKLKNILSYLKISFIIFLIIMLFFLQNKYPTESLFYLFNSRVILENIVIGNILLVIQSSFITNLYSTHLIL